MSPLVSPLFSSLPTLIYNATRSLRRPSISWRYSSTSRSNPPGRDSHKFLLKSRLFDLQKRSFSDGVLRKQLERSSTRVFMGFYAISWLGLIVSDRIVEGVTRSLIWAREHPLSKQLIRWLVLDLLINSKAVSYGRPSTSGGGAG